MAKIYKIQTILLFLVRRVEKLTREGELLGYDMFQAERNMVIITPIFKNLNLFFNPISP